MKLVWLLFLVAMARAESEPIGIKNIQTLPPEPNDYGIINEFVQEDEIINQSINSLVTYLNDFMASSSVPVSNIDKFASGCHLDGLYGGVRLMSNSIGELQNDLVPFKLYTGKLNVTCFWKKKIMQGQMIEEGTVKVTYDSADVDATLQRNIVDSPRFIGLDIKVTDLTDVSAIEVDGGYILKWFGEFVLKDKFNEVCTKDTIKRAIEQGIRGLLDRLLEKMNLHAFLLSFAQLEYQISRDDYYIG